MREPVIPQFDAETYLMWESRQQDRFELHHGYVVAFAGGTLAHAQIAFNLQVVMNQLFPDPCRTFGSEVKVYVSDRIVYYPDATVVCVEVSDEDTMVRAPNLVAEVLSPSTRTYDLIDKRAAYRALSSLDAYVIVHATMPRIEIDVRNADRSWRTETLDSGSFPLGKGDLTVDDVYERTTIAT